MLKVLRSLFTLALLLAAGVALAAAEVKPYAREDLASDVVRLTETLRKETAQIGAKLKGKSAEQLRKDAAAAVAAGDYKDAGALARRGRRRRPQGLRVVAGARQARRAADDAQADGRYDLVERGQTAAYAAYQRASGARRAGRGAGACSAISSPATKCWRPALDAYRASLDRHDDEDTRKVYEDMREKHGFRIVDYKVDNESSAPRICFNFSEPLARKTDFAPYVAVAGAADAAISAEDQQICVEGLKHGERYAIVLRQGLPSAVGESLLKDADYEIYVRDRSPQAHFAGTRLCAAAPGPARRAADHGQHRESVDRRLSRRRPQPARARSRATISSSRSPSRAPARSSRRTASRCGAGRWTSPPSSTRTSSPISRSPRRSASSQPGVYLVTARPWKGASAPAATSDDDQDDAARDAMDGRLRPRPDDLLRRRRHARAGAFARHRRAARRASKCG